ncbi:MAG: helix-turn-helix domain-containing protein [Planctomycetota bacterium]|nr:MAG: helix-turn-helix domain-containing protein [Planctomycetota bacterium]
MAKGKNVLTTGDVAKICNVAPRTVSKWFDSGQLKGYRIPGSKDRRIPVSELTRFMKLHNMPATAIAAGKTRVLIVDSDGASALANALQSQADYEVQTAGSNFEGGLVALKFAPHVLLVSLLAEDIDAAAICKTIRDNDELQATKVIALANRLTQSESEALLRKGFDGYISNPADAAEVIDKIEEATAIIY